MLQIKKRTGINEYKDFDELCFGTLIEENNQLFIKIANSFEDLNVFNLTSKIKNKFKGNKKVKIVEGELTYWDK